VIAVSGKEIASASVVVAARNAERELVVIGRVPTTGVQIAEQWIFGKYAYLSSIGDRIEVYDISNPSQPIQTDKITFDARLINDVSVTADGKTGVLTREGASSRRNGIVFLDTSDPAHPTIVSEYTETVTGGVHSAFLDGHYVYLTDDATGSLRVIDFQDIRAPREVARWEVESATAKTITSETSGGELSSGRSLHDVYVKDGLAYLAYWRDGLVILDVGNGIKRASYASIITTSTVTAGLPVLMPCFVTRTTYSWVMKSSRPSSTSGRRIGLPYAVLFRWWMSRISGIRRRWRSTVCRKLARTTSGSRTTSYIWVTTTVAPG
jgi:hypothetical protein